MSKPKTILLIEDERSDQMLFEHAIRHIENATIYGIANNGQEALDKLRDAQDLPDIIFTDINMPVMDGITLLGQLASMPLTKNIPVVILSTDVVKSGRAQELGAKAFIKKPEDVDLLRERIEHIINLDAWQPGSENTQTGFLAY